MSKLKLLEQDFYSSFFDRVNISQIICQKKFFFTLSYSLIVYFLFT